MTVASTLDDILRRFDAMPPEKQDDVLAKAHTIMDGRKSLPNPGPQTEAYFTEADELFYGGAAGGGKSRLICLLAVNEHQNALLLRRISKNLKGVKRELQSILGSTDGFNDQAGVWRHPRGVIDLGHCEHEGDKESYQGVAHDLKAFDEITQFTESQYTYIIGWNRSADPAQRCRVVVTGNPPTTTEGQWVIKRWGPWLDANHPNPAQPGELRWYTTIAGEDIEVEKDYVGPNGERPRSRTFIKSLLSDNPDLQDTGYAAVIEAMPEPLRTMMKEGRFDIAREDAAFQVIPTDWIMQAQARWTDRPPDGVSMTILSQDVALGGGDANAYAARYGCWYARVISEKSNGPIDPIDLAGRVLTIMRDGCEVVIDMGGGYGSGVYSHLKNNVQGIRLHGHNGSSGSKAKARDKKLGFANKRAEVWWKFREALEPGLGELVALPPDPELLADLAAPTWKLTPSGILIEAKIDIKKRLGRSPDKGDAVVNAWSYGASGAEVRFNAAGRTSGQGPKVNLGHTALKSRMMSRR
jgi:hypothetical protein